MKTQDREMSERFKNEYKRKIVYDPSSPVWVKPVWVWPLLGVSLNSKDGEVDHEALSDVNPLYGDVLIRTSVHSAENMFVSLMFASSKPLFFMEYRSAIELTKEGRISLLREITHALISWPYDVMKKGGLFSFEQGRKGFFRLLLS